MADRLFQGNTLYVAGRDLSGDWTSLSLRGGREAVEFTRGADVSRWSKPGLRGVTFEAEGIVDLGANLQDDILTQAIDLVDVPIIVGATDGTAGETAWAFLAQVGDYAPFNSSTIGDALRFQVSARATSSKLVRGTIVEDGSTARTATGNGTAFQLGAVSATQSVYATIVCLSASSGDTLDVVLASDNAQAFTTGTSQITFTQITATGAYEWKELAGANTDDWWRVEHTIAGDGSESFEYVVVVAIA